MFCLEGSPVGPNLLNDGFRGKWYGMQKKKLGQVRQYLEANRSRLQKGRSECNGIRWYLYGRTQAIKDVCRRKIVVNTCVKDLKSIKISVANAGEGVYGGLYVLTEESPETIGGDNYVGRLS